MITQEFEVLAGLVDMLVERAEDTFTQDMSIIIKGVDHSKAINIYREYGKPREFFFKCELLFSGSPANKNHGEKLGVYEGTLMDMGLTKTR